MGKLKQPILAALFMLIAGSCFAKQISFQVVQHDVTTEEITEPSFVVEDELLNGFFESGYIVTNSPAVISGSGNMDESLWSLGVGDAYEGSSDFFVQVKLYYTENLNKIDWSVTSVKTGQKLKSSSLKNNKTDLDMDDLKVISSNLVNEVNKVIKANKA